MQLLRVSFYAKPTEELYAACGSEITEWMKAKLEQLEGLSINKYYQMHISASLPFNDKYCEKLQDENCDLALLEQHFKKEQAESLDYPYEIKENQYYRHFKGKTVRIIAVAQDTEDPAHAFVVYEEWQSGKKWARPLEMFCSMVDKEKYPDSEQKWRFELIR